MSDHTPEHRTPISENGFHPLEVELMSFCYMPGKHAVSLLIPERPNREQARLVNMEPQTALNLLAWLRDEEATLQRLAEAEP